MNDKWTPFDVRLPKNNEFVWTIWTKEFPVESDIRKPSYYLGESVGNVVLQEPNKQATIYKKHELAWHGVPYKEEE